MSESSDCDAKRDVRATNAADPASEVEIVRILQPSSRLGGFLGASADMIPFFKCYKSLVG